MEASRATTDGANDPFDARTKRRLVRGGCLFVAIIFVWIVGSLLKSYDDVTFDFTNRSPVEIERLERLRSNGELLRGLPLLTGPHGFIQWLSPEDLEAKTLRIVHSGGEFDIDMAHAFTPMPFLRVDVVVDSLTPSGVTVTSYVDRRKILRELTPW